MDYADFYYSNVLGYTPNNSEDIKRTELTAAFLVECGLEKHEIVQALLQSNAKERLTPDDLPDHLWEGSLTRRGQFYYHHTLQLTSRPPHFDIKSGREIIEPYYLEMKIRYSMKDLLRYYYSKLSIDEELMDERRDAARMEAILKKYERLSFVSALDFVLSLIDYTAYAHQRVLNVFDIEKNEAEVFDDLKRKAAEASFHGKNVIVWRK